jgi:hypothetical protein
LVQQQAWGDWFFVQRRGECGNGGTANSPGISPEIHCVPDHNISSDFSPEERTEVTKTSSSQLKKFNIYKEIEEEATMEDILVLEIEELEDKTAPNIIWHG